MMADDWRESCIVVMKTSEITPLSAYKFADLVKEAGPVSDIYHGVWMWYW